MGHHQTIREGRQMKPIFAVPRTLVESKAPHGKPCTNCGICCLATQCELSRHVFGDFGGRAPCPALRFKNSTTSRCDLATSPLLSEEMRKAAATLIFAGRGCDARINGEYNDQKFTDRLNREDATTNREALAKARAAWGLEP